MRLFLLTPRPPLTPGCRQRRCWSVAVTFAYSVGLSDLSGLRLPASGSIPTATSVIDAYRAISSGFSNTEGPSGSNPSV